MTDSGAGKPWLRAYEIFDQLLDLDADSRRARLAELELDDTERRQVEALLGAAEGEGGVLDRPADASFADLVSPAPGRLLGAWRLGPELGRGGMSVVYRARREDAAFEQTAALKLLHSARLDRSSVARFEREQQILADLQHPNLATLLDGGVTDEGTPYLVMEEVHGERLDRYCAARRLEARQIVQLMLPVCDAVGFAHRRLVVHRDVKPANILVETSGRPRLLDFGVAKLLAEEPNDLTTTRVLTPGFGAPEQASGEAITTATDVYGLGAVLYRLLTGSTPYRADTPVADLRHPPTPPAPSSVPEAVSGVDSDLDNVVLKALRVEPERRYGGAEDLGRDLRNWTEGLPVSATPDRLVYRIRKFAARHRAGAIALLVAAFGLVVGSGLAFWQAAIARQESARAQAAAEAASRQAQRAEAVTDFLVSTFAAADPDANRGADVTVREVLTAGAEQIGEDLETEPATRARLRSVLGEISQILGELEMAESLLSENLASGDLDPELRLHDLELAGLTARVRGDFETAGARYRQALDLAEDAKPDQRALVEISYAAFLIESGQAEQALERLEHVSAQEWLVFAPAEALSNLEATLASALLQIGRLDDAAERARRAVELKSSLGDRGSTWLALSLGILANVRAEQGDLEAATELKRRALDLQTELLGTDHPHAQTSANDLATMLKNLGRFAESADLLESVLARQTQALGADHPNVGSAHFNLAQALFLDGRTDEALEHYRRAIEIADSSPTTEGPFRGVYRAVYGHALAQRHQTARGEATLDEGLRLLTASVGESHPLTARSRVLYAEVLNDQGRHRAALAEVSAARTVLDRTYDSGSRHVALAQIEEGRALAATDPAEAAQRLRQGVAVLQASAYRPQYQRQIARAESALERLEAAP